MTTSTPITVVIADDSALLREGVAGLLERQGFTVVAKENNADDLVRTIEDLAVRQQLPDVVLADVRMPPTMTDDGLAAVVSLRQYYPRLAVVVVSQYVAVAYAEKLLGLATGGGVGYLLKDRIAAVADFIQSVRLVANGGVVVDPDVTAAMMRARRTGLAELTERETEVLGLMARGKSNADIAAELFVSLAAVAKHVSNIFAKLHLEPGEDNRRVRAVLTFLAADDSATGR